MYQAATKQANEVGAMAPSEQRAALNGLEIKLFKLVAERATKAQWAEWLRAPLEHAVAQGDKSLALTLLESGADGGSGWKGCDGRTLLGAAAEGGNHEVVSTVLAAGGWEELDAVSGNKNLTALHSAIAGGHAEAARVLMSAGADVGLVDARKRSALHYAVEGGHLQLTEDVIVGGASLSAEDADYNTPLHLAAAHDDIALVDTLLRRGASVGASVINNKEQHPLHIAIINDGAAVAEALLKAGADPNICSEDADDDESTLPLCLARSNMAMTKILLENGADVKAVGDCEPGFTALHWAAEKGTPEVIDVLVEAGADLQALSGVVTYGDWGDNYELSPLHLTAWVKAPESMAALLRHGADANATDFGGLTPLHALCTSVESADSKLEAKLADLLLRRGADETLTDGQGCTPEQLVNPYDEERTRDLRRVLANAPADRAWRRRGMLVMCRAFPDRMTVKGGEPRASKASGFGGRGRGGGSAGSGHGRSHVVARVVGLEDDAIFRTIVGFL